MLLAVLVTAAACEACHGPGGNSAIAGTPSIAGQPQTFLENQLVFFREGLRHSPVMEPIAKDLKDAQIAALAKDFSKAAVKVTAEGKLDPKVAQRGNQLLGSMHCGQCHLPTYRGRAQMPRLAAQREEYLVSAMQGYRDNTRTGADTTMIEVLRGVPDTDIRAMAHVLARMR